MFEYFSHSKYESKIVPGVAFVLRKMSKGRRSAFNLKIADLIVKKTQLQQKLAPISEEIARAEEQAKFEPCSCSHPVTSEFLKTSLDHVDKLNEAMSTRIEIVDECHSSITKRCVVEGCSCRKPKPDPSVGGYPQYQEILEKILSIEANEIGVERIRYFVYEVQGLKIDDKDADIDLLLSDGPEFLIDELASEVSRLLTLSPEDTIAFPSRTTGGAAVESQEETTVQPNATPASKVSTTSSADADFTSPI